MPLIGRLLGKYDLALIQEDFVYPDALRRTLALSFQSAPFVRGEQPHFGDGLSQFSRFPFSPLKREAWQDCHGLVDAYFDCLTPKGFAWTRQALAEGVELDVYNVHLDAGWGTADAAAREAQVEQLVAAIAKQSSGRAVLLAGDTNIPRHQRSLLARLERATGLTDVCDALRCSDPGRIDRIFYRNSSSLRLSPKRWQVDRRFVDANRQPLSDHLAVAVQLDWRVGS
jgi:endonuclease/exonuclease/phosphatase family metal-dependent hydrolase